MTRVNDVTIKRMAGAMLRTVRMATIWSAVEISSGDLASAASSVMRGTAIPCASAPVAPAREEKDQQGAPEDDSTHAVLPHVPS